MATRAECLKAGGLQGRKVWDLTPASRAATRLGRAAPRGRPRKHGKRLAIFHPILL